MELTDMPWYMAIVFFIVKGKFYNSDDLNKF